ncbi:MAG: hypothetical protein MZV63_09015 [Marinilabiliales bacterium]|nr:hypothetical protein [Marinilabiliales bacterium]
MGQINFSGNLSVSASTSPRKKYYWETYILLGDPSLSPVIGRPQPFNVEIPRYRTTGAHLSQLFR